MKLSDPQHLVKFRRTRTRVTPERVRAAITPKDHVTRPTKKRERHTNRRPAHSENVMHSSLSFSPPNESGHPQNYGTPPHLSSSHPSHPRKAHLTSEPANKLGAPNKGLLSSPTLRGRCPLCVVDRSAWLIRDAPQLSERVFAWGERTFGGVCRRRGGYVCVLVLVCVVIFVSWGQGEGVGVGANGSGSGTYRWVATGSFESKRGSWVGFRRLFLRPIPLVATRWRRGASKPPQVLFYA